jgi:hypothetical protein
VPGSELTFIGTIGDNGLDVFIETSHGAVRPLDLRLDLRNHSPSGFATGYEGSGPAQLALAMCARLVDSETALAVYQDVKRSLVARIPSSATGWTVTGAQVLEAINASLDAHQRHPA